MQINNLELIPKTVYKDINILEGASQKFIDEVILLESLTNLQQRADEAKRYLKIYDGITAIDYKNLGRYLSNPEQVDKSIWRQLYLLERSIKPRNSNWSWVNRLKMFYNTYLEEHAVLYKPYKNSKFYFLNKSGDHERLHAGNGKFSSDFYYFDDTIPGNNKDKMVEVEFKYCYSDLQTEINKYSPVNSNHTYNATHVILYKKNEGFFMIDYSVDPISVEKLNIKEPEGLFEIRPENI